jgi:membrane fusion protein (multidrug efflux system)
MNRHTGRWLVAVAVLAGISWSGCQRPQQAPPQQVLEVAYITVEPQQLMLTSELQGRTAAFLVAEIRPQVNGLIKKRFFVEGSQVKAGQTLYQIDRAPYEAALENATANVATARKSTDRARAGLAANVAGIKRHEATLTLAKANMQRYNALLDSNTITAMQYDAAKAEVDMAEAALRTAEAQVESDREAVAAAEAGIKQAEAALKTAQINLSYTEIAAPISGRIGRSDVTEGAIVTAYQPLALATVQQFDPIYADIPQSTVDLSRLKRSLAAGRLKENGTEKVKIALQDGTPYPLPGSLQFRDVTVDPSTGSIALRIVVPNPDGILLPGMYVRAIIDEGFQPQAILVPQQALSRDPKGNPYVLLVDAEQKLQQRKVVTERAVGDKWLISSGLAAGDRVIVEGLQKAQRARPGTPVQAAAFVPGKAPAGNAETGKPDAGKPDANEAESGKAASAVQTTSQTSK